MNKTTRIIIAGGPQTGKTTRANALHSELDADLISTDSLIATHDWSAASEAVAKMIEARANESWIIEGVAAARALRKWFKLFPESAKVRAPATHIIHMTHPKIALSKGQEAMLKGEGTVWREIYPALLASIAKFGGRIEDGERVRRTHSSGLIETEFDFVRETKT